MLCIRRPDNLKPPWKLVFVSECLLGSDRAIPQSCPVYN